MAEKTVGIGTQDTGNPVLDSLVNLMSAQRGTMDDMTNLHEVLLELAEKEPGSLKVRGKDGHLNLAKTFAG